MKIALLTIWHEKNYGAEMQAYATIKALRELGHTVQMIDIRLSDQNCMTIKNSISALVKKLCPSSRQFNNFWNKYIPTTQRYRSISDLQVCPPKADVYLVGSDQVWNPDITRQFAPLYFLDFGDDRIKRISYASSFGVSRWVNETITPQVRQLLHRFDAVSCREQEGTKILQDTFGVEAECVLDPTLLFNGYPELVGTVVPKNTMVYYPLTTDPELENFAIKLADRLGLSVINNKKTTYLLGSIEWKRVTIEDWVRNIAEAKFVITRSFHGMAFCLIYHRQFVVIGNKNGRSSRITNLLNKLNIGDRYFESFEELNRAKPWETMLDYNRIETSLQDLREKSFNFLERVLK